jgi:hypothetical protein
MELEYTYPTEYPNPDYAGKTSKYIHRANKIVSAQAVQFTRNEKFSLPFDTAGGGLPLTLAIVAERQFTLVGSVNAAGWNIFPSHQSQFWLCIDMSARKVPESDTWVIGYAFKYDHDRWKELAEFIDPQTGKIPDDLVADTGSKSFRIYPVQDFSLLNLS